MVPSAGYTAHMKSNNTFNEQILVMSKNPFSLSDNSFSSENVFNSKTVILYQLDLQSKKIFIHRRTCLGERTISTELKSLEKSMVQVLPHCLLLFFSHHESNTLKYINIQDVP